ncbi:MAG TPA: hypothetical protein VMZ53_13930 [Kofleriaceae bacterium]|nr:hypothetical protein [Kofleriaceae bacterium]
MRAFSIGVVMMLASCGSSGGVQLLVTPTPDVERVALYVGVGDEDRQGLAPPGFGSPISTSTWVRDDHNELSEVMNVGGNQVSFGLLGPGDDLSIVIAVGFDGGGKAVAAAVLPKELRPLAIPSSYVARYELTLAPITAFDSASKLDVRVWKPIDPDAPGEKAECVFAADGRTGERVAVVAGNDADCDAWPTEPRDKECLPAVFMGTKLPKLDASTSCLKAIVANDPNASVAAPAAVLGGKKCVDGQGSIDGCFESNYCIPKSVLDSCMSFGDFTCAQDITAHQINVPTHMECYIHNDGNGKLCADPIPALSDPRQLIDVHSCKASSARISRPGQVWSNKVTFADPTNGTAFDITVANPTACDITLTPSGTLLAGTVDTERRGALVAGDLDNGRGLAMPYVFIIDPLKRGCGSPTPCTLAYGNGSIADGTFQCMNTAPL